MVYQTVAQTLGLNKPTDTTFDLIGLTREGIPRSAIDALANLLRISIPDLTHFHPNFRQVEIIQVEPYLFDSRLFER